MSQKLILNHNLKNIIIVSTLFIIFFIITAKSYATQISQDLSNNIFRLHILANSDSEEDQLLKLKVRDSILNYMNTLTKDLKNKEEVINLSQKNINKLQQIAEKTIQENGYNYNVTIEIGQFYFPTKYYGNISLPAGNYDALRIKIGQANGHNWWCSLFPPLCFVDVSSGVIDESGEKYLKDNLSNEEFAIVSNSNPNIKFKFKIIEMLNKKS